MKLRWQREGDDLRVTISGPLRWMQGGADPLKQLRAEVAEFARTARGRAIVDLSTVDQADPRSVFALLDALQPVREGGRVTFQGRGSAIAAMVAGGQIPWFEPIEAAPGEDPAVAVDDPWEAMVQSIPERPAERQDIWGSAARKIEEMLLACDAEGEEDDRPAPASPTAGGSPRSAKPPTERILREPASPPRGARPPVAPPASAAPRSPTRPTAAPRPAARPETPSRPGGTRDTVLPPRERPSRGGAKSGAGAAGRPLTRRERREQEEAARREAAAPRGPLVWFDDGLADPLGAATQPGATPPAGVSTSGSPPEGGLAPPPRTVSRAVHGVSPIDATPPEGQDVFEWFFAVGEQSVRQGSERVRRSGELPAAPADPSRAPRPAPMGSAPPGSAPPARSAVAKPLAQSGARGAASTPAGAEPLASRPAYQVIPASKLPPREPPPPIAPPARARGDEGTDAPPADPSPARPTGSASGAGFGWDAETLFSEFEARMAQRALESGPRQAAEGHGSRTRAVEVEAEALDEDEDAPIVAPPPAHSQLAPSWSGPARGAVDEGDEGPIGTSEARTGGSEPRIEVRPESGLAPAFPAVGEGRGDASGVEPAKGAADPPHRGGELDPDDGHDSDDDDDGQDDAHGAGEDFVIDLELEQLYLSRNPSRKDLVDDEGAIHFNDEWKPLSPGGEVVRAAPRAAHRPDPVQLLLRAEEEAESRRSVASAPAPEPPRAPARPAHSAPASVPAPIAPTPPAPPLAPRAAAASAWPAPPSELPPVAGRGRPARVPIAHAAHGEPGLAMPAAHPEASAARAPRGTSASPGPIGAFGSAGPAAAAPGPHAPREPFAARPAGFPAPPMSAPSDIVAPRDPRPPAGASFPASPPRGAEGPAEDAPDPTRAPRGEAMLRGVAKMLHQYGETDRAREEFEAMCRRLAAECEERGRELGLLRRECEELRSRAAEETPVAPGAEAAVPGWLATLAVPPTDPAPERARYGATLSRFRASGTVDPEQVLLAIDELSRSAGGIAAAVGGHFERGDQNPGDGWRALLLVVSTLVREGADYERRRRAIRIAWLASLVRCAPGSDGDPVAVGPAVARLLSGRAYRFPGEEATPIDPREADYDLALWRACARLDERPHLTPKRWRQSVGRTLATYEDDRAVRAGLARLIGTHSLYFPGTWVELTTGGIGPVIGAIPGRPELPRVLVLFRRNGQRGSRTPPQLFPAGDDSGAGVLRVLSRPHVAEENGNSLSMDTGGSVYMPKK